METTIQIFTDSSAAKSRAEKPGLMHMRHMQLRELFLKQIVQLGLVRILKIPTQVNPADMLTKPVHRKVIEKFWKLMENQMERDFEVNEKEIHLIEVMSEEAEQATFSWWMFATWTILAGLGVLWLIDKGQKLWNLIFVQEGGRREQERAVRRSSEQRAECRSVACMSMSSWLYGRTGRFVPTRACDQGVFLDGMPISVDREMAVHSRDIHRVS